MSRAERALLCVAILLSAAWIVLACFRPSGTIDIWWTLKVGDYIWSEGRVPRTTLWTMDAVRDLPYVAHGWLSALVFSSVKEMFGLDAVPLVPTLVALALFACLVWLGLTLGASWLLAVAVADIALYVALPRMICRTEVFGYLHLTIALVILAAYLREARARTLAWLAPLALVWVNSHGSFLLLLGLLPLLAAGLALDVWRGAGFRREALRASVLSRSSATLFAAWLVICGITLINPYGFDLIRTSLDQSTSNVWREHIAEWAPLYARGSLPPRFVVPAVLVLAALAAGLRRVSFVSVLLAACFAYLAVSSQRHLILFGIAAAFLLGDLASHLKPGPRMRASIAVSLVALLLAVDAAVVRRTGSQDRSLTRNPSSHITHQGLQFVRDHVHGNVLNRWHLGGLLIYFAYPQVRVCIDSRADPYPPAYFHDYQRALTGTASETLAFVDRYAIDHIIVDRAMYDAYFRPKLPGLAGFAVAFADRRTVVLSRQAPRLRSGQEAASAPS